MLQDIGFSIERGEMVALIGASGSGKSTLIGAIAARINRDADRRALVGIFHDAKTSSGRSAIAASTLTSRRGFCGPTLHVRCEICADHVAEQTKWLLDTYDAKLISLMDHTPGARQFCNLSAWKT